jgi:lipoprotein-releasing system permease protein
VINLITRISVIGITLITASLVVLLSAFNGIEGMIEKLYSDFDPDITIRSASGKTFPEETIAFDELRKVQGVNAVSRAIEEVIVIKHEKKWVNASMIAVDSSFLEMSGLTSKSSNGNYIHMVDGFPVLTSNDLTFGVIGATLLDKLGGYIPEKTGFEQVLIYAPKRDVKVRIGSNPFNTRQLNIAGRMNFNREVNAEKLLVPLSFGADILNYTNDLSAVYIDVKRGYTNDEVKAKLIAELGTGFTVKTSYEKNELIFKTSKSEKLMVIVILVFIFILAAFNLVASLTMLFVEKKDNVFTMIAYGADYRTIFRIFFFEGLLICGKGILFGLVLGYSVCALQIYGSILEMPNTGGEPFPVQFSLADGMLIFFLVSALSFIFSFWPVKYLMKRNFGTFHF